VPQGVLISSPSVPSPGRSWSRGVLGLLAAPPAAGAQPAGKVRRVGYLSSHTATSGAQFIEAFRQGLREIGWIEGQNIVIEYRFAEGKFDRLPALAAELVRLRVDLIVAAPTPAAAAAKNATGTIPIVMTVVADPVGLGLIASLAHPGGNVTGLSYSVGVETFGKELELLKETLPKVRRLAILSNPAIGPRARDKTFRGRSSAAGSPAPAPGGPRSRRVRRRLRGDGQRARGRTPRHGRLDVQSPPHKARRPRSKEPPTDDARQ